MGCLPIADNLPAFHQVSLTVCWYPFVLLGGERHCGESKVSCPRTQHNDLAWPLQGPSKLPCLNLAALPKSIATLFISSNTVLLHVFFAGISFSSILPQSKSVQFLHSLWAPFLVHGQAICHTCNTKFNSSRKLATRTN